MSRAYSVRLLKFKKPAFVLSTITEIILINSNSLSSGTRTTSCRAKKLAFLAVNRVLTPSVAQF